jgi:hypothetical protein
MRCRGGGYRSEHDTTDCKQGNRPQIEAKFSPAHRDRRRVDQGRQHEQQDKLWREPHCGQAWDNCQEDTRQHKQNCWRNIRSFRHDSDRSDCDQQEHQSLDLAGDQLRSRRNWLKYSRANRRQRLSTLAMRAEL